jgi:hypothetical protein
MLPSADLTSTRPISSSALLRGTATVADPRQDGAVRLDQIAVGKALLAQVVSVLADGTSLVRLSNQEQAANFSAELRMQLPTGTKAGDSLKLTLLTKTPQLTFGVSNPLPADTTPTTLSQAGRLIETLLKQTDDAQQKPQVQGAKPLLSAADTQTPQLADKLAAQLHKTVDGSGVFYESHLRQWADGERTLAQVRSEPQNQAGNPAASQTPVGNTQMLPLQLNSLEQQRFAWHGEVWPGQRMDWEVVQEDHSQASGQNSPEANAAWQTVLHLDLPRLGKVSAAIRLQGEHAQLQMQVQDPQAASELKLQTAALSEAMAASGTALDGLTVHSDELT